MSCSVFSTGISATSAVLEAVGLELQGAGILGHDPYLVLRETVGLACADLDPDLQFDTFWRGEMLDDLLGEAGQIAGVALRIEAGDAEETNVLRPRRRLLLAARSGAGSCALSSSAGLRTSTILADPASGPRADRFPGRSGALGTLPVSLCECQVRPDEQHLVRNLADRVSMRDGQPEIAPGLLVVSGGDRESLQVPGQFAGHSTDAVIEDTAVPQSGQVGMAAVVAP